MNTTPTTTTPTSDVESVESVEATTLPAPQPLRDRIRAALVRIVAVLDLYRAVPTSDVECLSDSDRAMWTDRIDTIEYRVRTFEAFTIGSDYIEDADLHSTETAERAAELVEQWSLESGAVLAQAIEDARRSMPIGHEPTSDTLDESRRRGARFVEHCRSWSGIEDARRRCPDTTVWDVLTFGRDIEARALADVRSISRTLRAADVRHGYGQFERIMREMIENGSLTHPAWRHSTSSVRLVLLSSPESVATVVPGSLLPSSPREMGYGRTVASLVECIEATRRATVSDIETLGARLLDEATDGVGSGWCNEYESTMERLNSSLSLSIGWEPFKGRTTTYEATGSIAVTVTITTYLPVCATFEARPDEDVSSAAYDALNDADVDSDTYAIAEALGIDRSTFVRWSTDVEIEGSIEDVDWSEA